MTRRLKVAGALVFVLVLAAASPVAAGSDPERPFKGTAEGYGMVQPVCCAHQ
jgi:hypothetical protein